MSRPGSLRLKKSNAVWLGVCSGIAEWLDVPAAFVRAVFVIAVFDLTTEGRNVIADTFLSFEIWMTVAAIYLVLTVTLSVFVSYLEHRVRARD